MPIDRCVPTESPDPEGPVGPIALESSITEIVGPCDSPKSNVPDPAERLTEIRVYV